MGAFPPSPPPVGGSDPHLTILLLILNDHDGVSFLKQSMLQLQLGHYQKE